MAAVQAGRCAAALGSTVAAGVGALEVAVGAGGGVAAAAATAGVAMRPTRSARGLQTVTACLTQQRAPNWARIERWRGLNPPLPALTARLPPLIRGLSNPCVLRALHKRSATCPAARQRDEIEQSPCRQQTWRCVRDCGVCADRPVS